MQVFLTMERPKADPETGNVSEAREVIERGRRKKEFVGRGMISATVLLSSLVLSIAPVGASSTSRDGDVSVCDDGRLQRVPITQVVGYERESDGNNVLQGDAGGAGRQIEYTIYENGEWRKAQVLMDTAYSNAQNTDGLSPCEKGTSWAPSDLIVVRVALNEMSTTDSLAPGELEEKKAKLDDLEDRVTGRKRLLELLEQGIDREDKICMVVVDTGQPKYSSLSKLVKDEDAYNVVDGESKEDLHGHSTLVTAVIVLNELGIKPQEIIEPAYASKRTREILEKIRFITIKLLDKYGRGTYGDIAEMYGVLENVTQECGYSHTIVNQSWGGTSWAAPPGMEGHYQNLSRLGVVFTIAAGNSTMQGCLPQEQCPKTYPSILWHDNKKAIASVIAVSPEGHNSGGDFDSMGELELAWYSNYGYQGNQSDVGIVVVTGRDGLQIPSRILTGVFEGTSFSAPRIAGKTFVVALAEGLPVQEALKVLRQNSSISPHLDTDYFENNPHPSQCPHNLYGIGIPDVAKVAVEQMRRRGYFSHGVFMPLVAANGNPSNLPAENGPVCGSLYQEYRRGLIESASQGTILKFEWNGMVLEETHIPPVNLSNRQQPLFPEQGNRRPYQDPKPGYQKTDYKKFK